MNNKTKRTKVLGAVAVALILGNSGAHAVVIASWDTWADTTTTYDADSVTTDFTATIATAADRINTNASLGSIDGTFGDNLSGATTGVNDGVLLLNNANNTATIVITNNTGTSYSIDSIHFDFGVRTSSATDFTLTYVSGGLGTNGTVIDTQDDLSLSGSLTYHDFDYDLSDDLTDTILADGESATFTIVASDYASPTASAALDNVAIQGVAVPEPSSVALLDLGGFSLILRRRR